MRFKVTSSCAPRYQTYAPKGVHVAHVVIDGVIESPNTKAWADKARCVRKTSGDKRKIRE